MTFDLKFYTKYFIIFIPLSLMVIFSLFMPKDKAIKFILESRLFNKMHGWLFK
jgi:hypothetical protein